MSDVKPVPGIGSPGLVELPVLVDPDAIPVRVVDAIAGVGIMGASSVFLNLATNRMGRLTPEGDPQNEYVVAARLRFDLQIARLIRDALTSQIALLDPPDGPAS